MIYLQQMERMKTNDQGRAWGKHPALMHSARASGMLRVELNICDGGQIRSSYATACLRCVDTGGELRALILCMRPIYSTVTVEVGNCRAVFRSDASERKIHVKRADFSCVRVQDFDLARGASERFSPRAGCGLRVDH